MYFQDAETFPSEVNQMVSQSLVFLGLFPSLETKGGTLQDGMTFFLELHVWLCATCTREDLQRCYGKFCDKSELFLKKNHLSDSGSNQLCEK